MGFLGLGFGLVFFVGAVDQICKGDKKYFDRFSECNPLLVRDQNRNSILTEQID